MKQSRRKNINRRYGLPALLFAFLCLAAGTVHAQEVDLTGLWQDEHLAKYYIRHTGNELFWRMDDSPGAVNVFHGVITGITITGEWADLPEGSRRGNGILVLRIESPDKLVLVDSDTPYSSTTWTRVEAFVEKEVTSETKSEEGSGAARGGWEIFIKGPPALRPPPPPMSPLEASTVVQSQERDSSQDLQLQITDIRVEQEQIVPDEPCAGFRIRATFTVSNTGHVATGPEHRNLGLCFAALYYVHDKYRSEAELKPQTGSACFITGTFFDDLAPGASKDLTLSIPVNNMPFWIRGDLYRPSETETGKVEIMHSYSETYFFEGPDLRILEATITGPAKGGSTATASLVVENAGGTATPGTVEAFITVPRKNTPTGGAANPQNRSCHWTFDLPPIPPGKNMVTGRVEVPIRGEPDWEHIHLGVYTKCPAVPGGIGWDVEIRDNFFLSTSHLVPKEAWE